MHHVLPVSLLLLTMGCAPLLPQQREKVPALLNQEVWTEQDVRAHAQKATKSNDYSSTLDAEATALNISMPILTHEYYAVTYLFTPRGSERVLDAILMRPLDGRGTGSYQVASGPDARLGDIMQPFSDDNRTLAIYRTTTPGVFFLAENDQYGRVDIRDIAFVRNEAAILKRLAFVPTEQRIAEFRTLLKDKQFDAADEFLTKRGFRKSLLPGVDPYALVDELAAARSIAVREELAPALAAGDIATVLYFGRRIQVYLLGPEGLALANQMIDQVTVAMNAARKEQRVLTAAVLYKTLMQLRNIKHQRLYDDDKARREDSARGDLLRWMESLRPPVLRKTGQQRRFENIYKTLDSRAGDLDVPFSYAVTQDHPQSPICRMIAGDVNDDNVQVNETSSSTVETIRVTDRKPNPKYEPWLVEAEKKSANIAALGGTIHNSALTNKRREFVTVHTAQQHRTLQSKTYETQHSINQQQIAALNRMALRSQLADAERDLRQHMAKEPELWLETHRQVSGQVVTTEQVWSGRFTASLGPDCVPYRGDFEADAAQVVGRTKGVSYDPALNKKNTGSLVSRSEAHQMVRKYLTKQVLDKHLDEFLRRNFEERLTAWREQGRANWSAKDFATEEALLRWFQKQADDAPPWTDHLKTPLQPVPKPAQ